ncbi:MAG: phage tail protein [Waterburya sp.]
MSVSGIYVWAEEPTKIVNERKEGGFFGIGGTTIRETTYSGNFALLFGDVPEGYIAFLNRLTINGETAFWDKNIANTIINSYNQAAFEAIYRNDDFNDSWYYTTITEGLIQRTISLPEAIDNTNAGTDEEKTIARNNCYWANKIRFFTGDDEQTAPVWMGSKVGANKVAQWQRFAYCTVKDFPLSEYGNSFPRLEAIISIVPKITTLGTAGRKGYYFQVVVAGTYLGSIDKKAFAVPLADIVASICLRSGLMQSQFNVSDLARVENNKKELVRGIKIEQNGEGYREPLQELQRVYLFGVREENGVLNFEFTKATAAKSPISVELLELGSFEDGTSELPDRFLDTRIQEIEVPSTISLSYLDYELLLDRNEARVETPLPPLVGGNKRGVRIESLDTNIVFTLSEASTAAKRLLEQVWIQREQFVFKLPPRWADTLVANQLLKLPILGSEYTILVQELTVGNNLLTEVKGVLYDEVVLGEQLEEINDREPVVTYSQGFVSIDYAILDIPLIDDDHADHTIYVVADNYCSLIESDAPGGEYGLVGQFLSHKGAMGRCENVLNNNTNPYLFDYNSELTVKISSNANTLVTSSFDDCLALKNLALVGQELISFQTVTPLGGDRYKLSNLARGCRGTDRRTNTHVVNERFILLGGYSPNRLTGNDSLVNVDRYFKALAIGQNESDVSSSNLFNYKARSNQLYLTNLRYGRLVNGDLEIFYEVRSRNNTNFGRVINRDPIEAILISIIINNQSRAYSLDYDPNIANSKIITLSELSTLFGFSVTATSTIVVAA